MRIRCIIRSMDSTLKIWGNKMGKKRLPVQCWDKSWLCLPVYLWQTILGLSNFSSFLFLHLTLIQPFEIMQRCHLAVLLMPLGLCCPVCLVLSALEDPPCSSLGARALILQVFWNGVASLIQCLHTWQAGRQTHLGAGYVILGSAHHYSLEKHSPNSTHWNTTLQQKE